VTVSRTSLSKWISDALTLAQTEEAQFQVEYYVPRLEELQKEVDAYATSIPELKKEWNTAVSLAAQMKVDRDKFEALYTEAEAQVTKLNADLSQGIKRIQTLDAENALWRTIGIAGGIAAVVEGVALVAVILFRK